MKLKDKNIYGIPINLHKKRALLLTIVVISYCLFIPRIISFFEPQNIAESGFHKYKPIIIEMANIYNVPPDLVAAMIKTESDFRHNVVSSQGARGLMQVLPSTAKSLQITNLHDPKENIRAGTKYLKQLINQFNGNIKLAVAAYNAGPTAVKKHGNVPHYKETMRYVSKVLKYKKQFKTSFVM